jgi:putative addiction module component (TIGR02574 family)
VEGEKTIPRFAFIYVGHLCNHSIVEFIMFKDVNHVIEEAMHLPPEDRLRVADQLYGSVPEDDIAQAWIEEVERRQAEFDAGLVQGVDLEDVLKEARDRIAK